jgi:serine protease Do
MTKGIISAKGREIGEINKFPLIQTDAPINPGNSGGPLVNMRGMVVGVNSAIDARAQGIGFAIPIDEVKAILPQLEKDGRIRQGYLGVGLDELNPQAAQYLGLKDTQGVLISSVDPRGPAGKAGIQPYDVITEFNGKKIESVSDLVNSVSDSAIGSKAKLKLMREGKTKNMEVTVAERPSNPTLKGPAKEKQRPLNGLKAPNDLGFTLSDMNDQVRQEFNLSPEAGNHPVVLEVQSGSRADEVGMMAGDVILEVNRKEVKSAQDALKQLRKGTNTLRIARGDAVAIIMF